MHLVIVTSSAGREYLVEVWATREAAELAAETQRRVWASVRVQKVDGGVAINVLAPSWDCL